MANGDLRNEFSQPFPSLVECPDIEEVIKQAALLKYRDIVHETIGEFSRRGNYVRIYPAKNSYKYDQYFQGSRPLNKMLYKVFFSQDKCLVPQTFNIMQITNQKDEEEDPI
jgi:hypothetical protein